MSVEAAPKKQSPTQRAAWLDSLLQSEDLFLKTEGRTLRNKQKKLDKILATEKGIRKGERNPNEDQKLMIEGKPAL